MDENETTVKLEVDMEPLKVAFDNVAEGFTDQGRAIQKLWFFQGLLALALIATNIVSFLR